MNESDRTLIVIFGPTASGKTDLAIQLAHKLNTEIINADSRQIYKHFNIGTAKPPKDDVNSEGFFVDGIKHHMIDFLDPNLRYNAYDYETNARKIVDTLFDLNKIPIVAGGTGLYIDALTYRRSLKSAEIDEEERKRLNQLTLEELHEEAKVKAKEKFEDLNNSDRNNPRRLIRLIEKAEIVDEDVTVSRPNCKTIYFCPYFDREKLMAKIDDRVIKMFEMGWIDEVRGLLQKGYTRRDPAFEIIGYPEILDLLEGHKSKEEVINLIQISHRQYAKRQITWMKQYSEIFFAKNPQDILDCLN